MPPEYNSQNSPVQQISPRNEYFLTTLSILLFITGVFGLWYLLNGSPQEETENLITAEELAEWKIFQDEEYGFEFKYPKNMIPMNYTYESTERTAFYTMDDFLNGMPQQFEFSADVLPENETLLMWVDYMSFTSHGDPYKQVNFNNNKFIKWYEDIGIDKRITHYSILVNNNIITFDFKSYFDGWEQVLSTFNFISTSTPLSTSTSTPLSTGTSTTINNP